MAVAVVSAGCGSGRPKSNRPATALARGLVTYRGEPVSDAVLVFQPSAQGGFAASAMTDREGRFDLKAFPPDSGAVPGSYGVVVMKVSQEDVASEGGPGNAVAQPASLIPAKYSDASKSGLNAEVPAEGTEMLLFELKD